ncbi:MAG TPA: VOC family protein [Gemmatimonadaceae bacterium]|nr:VOC family protein [Gemmatimonadaceae bacterium]
MDELSRLFSAYDRGTITRRQLFQVLGLAAVATPLARAVGQGSCAGRDRDSSAACTHTTMKPPFDPTGWKTVLLDHFTMHVTDAEKEAAFYAAFLGWKVRSNDGNVIVMDMGDLGGVQIRGGYTPPARGAGRGGGGGGRGGRGGAPGDTTGGGRGGGAGRGGAAGGAGGGGRVQFPPCQTPRMALVDGGGATWDGFAWGIAPWDEKKVEAALKSRGLNPVPDHQGNDYRAFHVKDPDGMDLWITNGNRNNRRTTPPNGKLNAPLPFESTGFQTKYLDHISYRVTSYKETVAFYEALLGWKGLGDEGSQNETQIAPEIGGLLIRGGNALAPGFEMPANRSSAMDHISFGITPFDPDKVYEALCARGLQAQVDTGSIATSPPAEQDIHTATYKSFHTRTPNNFNLQFSAKISPTQKTGPG